MIELSDEDRAAIADTIEAAVRSGPQLRNEDMAYYIASECYKNGIRAGFERAAKDSERLDFLQHVKSATFRPLNMKMHDSSAIELFTVPSQHVRGNTVREAIDAARQA